MSIEEIKEQLEGVQNNLTIYVNDLERFTRKLKDDYGLEEDEIEDRSEEIGVKISKLKKRKRKLKRSIEKEFEKIELS